MRPMNKHVVIRNFPTRLLPPALHEESNK